MKNYSWKTSASAVVAIITTWLSLVIVPLLDSDAATKPKIDEAVSITVASLIGFFSRDDDKTSEQVGAK
jgi:hypothetical protein